MSISQFPSVKEGLRKKSGVIALGFFLFLCCVISTASGRDGTALNYDNSKYLLGNKVYFDHRRTIYCDASFDERRNIRLPAGFETPKQEKRAYKMEWEHAVPAENFGRAFVEWREGDPVCVSGGKPYKGRKCARKASEEYRNMEGDMYNLFPAIGAVNAIRGHKAYSELPGEPYAFGECKAKVKDNRFEPPPAARGQLARASLYMESRYSRFRLSRQQKRLFEAWNRLYPVDRWECVRARRIESLQGNENSFVKYPCLKAGLW